MNAIDGPTNTTFQSTRAALESDDTIVSAAVIRMCCITAKPGSLKRYDIWHSPDGTVVHACATDRNALAPGIVTHRSTTAAAIAALIAGGVGGLPTSPRTGRTSLPSVDDLLPAIVRSDVPADRAVVVGRRDDDGATRYVVCVEMGGGGLLAVDVDLESRLRLEPATAPEMWGAIVGLLP